MIKLIAFIVIAGLAVGIFYLSYLYVSGKKFIKHIPKALFFGGPYDGYDFIIGPYKDNVLITMNSHVDEQLYALYEHDGHGFYDWVDTVWKSEVDLDKCKVIDYNDLTSTSEQEETNETTNNSGESNRDAEGSQV